MPPAAKIAPQFHLQVAFVRVLRGQGTAEGALELKLETRLRRPNLPPTAWRPVWRGSLAEGEVLPLLGVEGDWIGFEIPSVSVEVEVRLQELDRHAESEEDTAIAAFQLGTSPTHVQRILTLELPEQETLPAHRGITAQVEVSILSTMAILAQD